MAHLGRAAERVSTVIQKKRDFRAKKHPKTWKKQGFIWETGGFTWKNDGFPALFPEVLKRTSVFFSKLCPKLAIFDFKSRNRFSFSKGTPPKTQGVFPSTNRCPRTHWRSITLRSFPIQFLLKKRAGGLW